MGQIYLYNYAACTQYLEPGAYMYLATLAKRRQLFQLLEDIGAGCRWSMTVSCLTVMIYRSCQFETSRYSIKL